MASMPLSSLLLLLLLLRQPVPSDAHFATATGDGGTQEWDYTEVRPGAHLFWWLYYSEEGVSSISKDWPLIMWLQGGPGGSGVGFGNFQEVGPLTVDLKPRSSTWLNMGHLLFVALAMWRIRPLLQGATNRPRQIYWPLWKSFSVLTNPLQKTLSLSSGSRMEAGLLLIWVLHLLRRLTQALWNSTSKALGLEIPGLRPWTSCMLGHRFCKFSRWLMKQKHALFLDMQTWLDWKWKMEIFPMPPGSGATCRRL